MKLNANRLTRAIVVSLSLAGLVGCGGTDPNDSAVTALIPTCKIKSNWLLIHKGLTVDNVTRVLGNPDSRTITGNTITHEYVDCRIIIYVVTKDDPATPENEFETDGKRIGGTVVFTNGYASSIISPQDIDEVVYYEYTDAEVLAYTRGQ